ncbi:MAG: hypothetical protein A4E63_02272 [Syntrophorhabdus sp. PtaU1.Bin050]|nr:MAG: hypothetical protein A4E63_02272 [Syntrophorhabdus sp. PtaU1.Bin050]
MYIHPYEEYDKGYGNTKGQKEINEEGVEGDNHDEYDEDDTRCNQEVTLVSYGGYQFTHENLTLFFSLYTCASNSATIT